MDDREAKKLLAMLHKYVTEYAPDIPQTIQALAEDLRDSLGYDPEAERMVDEIRYTEGVS